MAKHSTHMERRKSPFVQIYKWEMACPAFTALDPNEVVIYLWMRSLYNGGNNGRIHMSTRRAASYIHKSNSTGKRALDRLIRLGFLKVRHGSTFDQKRLAREFELTALSTKPAEKASSLPKGSCDFMRFQSLKEVSEFEKSFTLKKSKHSAKHGGHSAIHDKRREVNGISAKIQA